MFSRTLLQSKNLFVHTSVAVRTMASAPKVDFVGEVTELYEVLAKQHTHENGPWNKMIAATKAALPEGTGVVLDIASGPGEPGLSIAKAMPSVQVTVTDISQDQLDVATRRCTDAGVTNVKFAVSNAEDLSQFASSSVDVITCCYGYMFCDDRQRAVTEAFRVLKPGGRLISTCWKSLPAIDLAKITMTAALNGETPPEPPINPMSLSAPDAFQELLVGAGFHREDITSSESTYPFVFQGAKDFQFKLGTLVIHSKLAELKEQNKLAELKAATVAFWKGIEEMAGTAAPRVAWAGTAGASDLQILDNRFELTISEKK